MLPWFNNGETDLLFIWQAQRMRNHLCYLLILAFLFNIEQWGERQQKNQHTTTVCQMFVHSDVDPDDIRQYTVCSKYLQYEKLWAIV